MTKFQPVIKWSGSKRSQAEEIVACFPRKMATYYEPFCGGASVTRMLIESDVNVGRIVCSDLNEGLVNLWHIIKDEPQAVADSYSYLWHELNAYKSVDGKRWYFEKVRERYNRQHDPLDFFFIMRTTTNGMPRYNRDGDFNNSFHLTRNGIEPSRAADIINEWSALLNRRNVCFVCQSYENVHPTADDFLYLDPPYAGTKGMYFGGFDNQCFFAWMEQLPCRYALSYDGISGDSDNTYPVPQHLWSKHLFVKSGNSSFKRVIGNTRDAMVYESLYLNYEPQKQPTLF